MRRTIKRMLLASSLNVCSYATSLKLEPRFVSGSAKYAMTKDKSIKEVSLLNGQDVIIYCDVGTRDTQLPLKLFVKHYERYNKVKAYIEIYADMYNLPLWFLSTLLYNESQFDNNARSSTGVKGIAMITETTRKQFGIKGKDARSQIKGMAKILSYHIRNLPEYYNDNEKMQLAALIYNRGKGSYWNAKRHLKKQGKDLTLGNMLKQMAKYRNMKEGMNYIKRLNNNKSMFI